MWCFTDLTQNVKDTHIEGTNSWVDDFDHGATFGAFLDGQGGYRVFNTVDFVNKTVHWLHNNHWMVDIVPKSQDTPADWTAHGGGMIRPNKSFKFENGKLVVEAECSCRYS